jgi:hypothetical protein
MVLGILFIIVGVFLIFVGFLEPISIFSIIFGIVFAGIGGIVVKISAMSIQEKKIINNPERKEKAFQKWISENMAEYNVSREDMKHLHSGEKYYIFKPEIKKLIFIEYNPKYLDKIKEVKDDFKYIVVDLNKVRKISLRTNEKIIGEITKENGIGRALVGGALFGTAGAIVGGLTAKEKQTQTNKITSIKLEIITNDLTAPYSTIVLYSIVDEAKTDFEKMKHTIQNLYWSLENCLQQESVV